MIKKISLLFLFLGFYFPCIVAQSLDNTFGENGLVINDFSTSIDGIQEMVLQNDGKILTVGYIANKFSIVRYNPNGTYDASFGNNGIVKTNFSHSRGSNTDVIIQPDNKILVLGTNNYKPFIARYNSNGTPDSTFGNNGIRFIVVLERDNTWMPAMVLSKEGKIIIGGTVSQLNPTPDYIYLLRLNTDGSTDTSFGTGGNGLSLLSGNINYNGGIAVGSNPRDIVLNSDGDIIVLLGYTQGIGSKAGIIKYSPSGVWDENFGEGGLAVSHNNIEAQINPSKLKILSDGKIISSSRVYPNPRGFVLMKHNADGTTDTNFGTNGVVTTPVPGRGAIFNGMEILSDGKIMIAGDSNETFTSILYHPNGERDTTYGNNGYFIYKFETSSLDYATTVFQQPNGKIIIGGSTSHRCVDTGFALMRFDISKETLSSDTKILSSKKNVELYPNPTFGKIFINLPKEFSDTALKIYNVGGQEIQNYHFNNTNNNIIDIDLNVNNGIYFIQIFEKNKMEANFKIIKK